MQTVAGIDLDVFGLEAAGHLFCNYATRWARAGQNCKNDLMRDSLRPGRDLLGVIYYVSAGGPHKAVNQIEYRPGNFQYG